MAVEIDGFAERRIFFAGFEEVALHGLERHAIAFANGFNDGARVDAFVDVERNGWDFEGGVFGFASPDESRIEMGIVIVGLARSDGRIGALSDEADRRIVYPGFRFVIVLLDRTFAARFFIFWWSFFLAGHGA